MTLITFHSFRRGVGRSHIVANLAGLLADSGRRVGLIDGNLRLPGLSAYVGLPEPQINRTLNDYLRGKCEIEQATYAITTGLGTASLWLIPASTNAQDISYATRYGYDIDLFANGLLTIREEMALDLLLVEMHAGLDEESIRLMAIADKAAIVLRHDQSDYQGTAVMVDVVRKLDGPIPLLIANELPRHYPTDEAITRLEAIYNCQVAGVLHHNDDLQITGSGLFVARHPTHPLTKTLQRIAENLLS
jgi:MinD-like ATPase involved in chromosome partitioning or flagellar assembly